MSAGKFTLIVLLVAASLMAYYLYYMNTAPAEVKVVVEMGEYYYYPSEITVRVNSRLHLTFINKGNYPHNAYLAEEKRELVTILYPSNSTTVEMYLAKEGIYSILCTIAYPAPVSHYELGMRAKVTAK